MDPSKKDSHPKVETRENSHIMVTLTEIERLINEGKLREAQTHIFALEKNNGHIPELLETLHELNTEILCLHLCYQALTTPTPAQ